MKLAKRLLGGRRWMLWLPVLVAGLGSGGELAMFGKILVGGVLFWVPFWLAWWLSDGFRGLYLGRCSISVSGGVSPWTGWACTVTRFENGATIYSE